jgi:hypothetical protein
LSSAALKNVLLSSVDPVPALSGKTSSGGRLNVDKALRSCAAPVPSSLQATFLGTTGQDLVGQGGALQPNGVVDWRIKLQGLRGTPSRVRVTAGGGVWEAPFNGANWLVATQYAGDGSGDIWFEPWSSPSTFHVKVFYSDSSTDEVDASRATGSANASWNISWRDGTGFCRTRRISFAKRECRLACSIARPPWFANQSSSFYRARRSVGSTLQRLKLARGNPDGRGGTGDFWFEPFGNPAGLHVKVWYADGTTDETDPTFPASSLTAAFFGVTGEDKVGTNGLLSPNGNADWHIRPARSAQHSYPSSYYQCSRGVVGGSIQRSELADCH